MFKQLDWTGETGGHNPDVVLCPVCFKPLRNSKEDSFYGRPVGRPSDYCSDACKMKAYRQRNKSLRNLLHHDTKHDNFENLAIEKYNFSVGRVHSDGDTYIIFGGEVVTVWAAGWKVQKCFGIYEESVQS